MEQGGLRRWLQICRHRWLVTGVRHEVEGWGSGELVRPRKMRERAEMGMAGDTFVLKAARWLRAKRKRALRACPRGGGGGGTRGAGGWCGGWLMRGPERVQDPFSAAGCGREREERPGGDRVPTRAPGRRGFKLNFK
jgi:hypothetical protein